MVSGQSRKYLGVLAAVCVSALGVGGCTHMPKDASDQAAENNDPIEPFNRAIYQFNYGFDTVLLKPLAQGYRYVVPEKGRDMVSNFLVNLYTPVTFANSVLQADPQNSFATFWRFILNTTVGIGGLFDVASEAGLKNRPADLGQTFAFYGAGTGPYIVLPVIGPSNARDALGRAGDAFINPFNYINTGTSIAIWSATAIDKRASSMELINGIYDSSLDPYATFRSGYTQKRASDIKRAKASRDKAIDALCKAKKE